MQVLYTIYQTMYNVNIFGYTYNNKNKNELNYAWFKYFERMLSKI